MNADFWQGKKVFLTGHTGFKGAWLSLWLSHMGAHVTGYALEPPTQPSLFALARVGEVVNSVLGDVTDAQQVQLAMRVADPDIVIHMAAQALVRKSYHAPLDTYQTNIMGTINVLDAIRYCKHVKAALVVTTDKCYENKEWHWGYRENEPLGGYDPYSSSKACAEIVTAAYRQSFLDQEGVSIATARAGNVIGGGDWAEDRLIPDCLRAVQKKKTVVIRNPAAIRPWQHVLEPLSGYMLLLEKLYQEGNVWAESWNFGPKDNEGISVGEIVRRICESSKCEYVFQVKEQQPHEATYLKLDCSKAKDRLQWQTKFSINDCLAFTIAWFEQYFGQQDMREFTLYQIKNYMDM